MRKYWPKGEEPEVKKEDEEVKPKLSIEQEFDLLTKKKEAELELEDMRIEVEDTEGETKDTSVRREVIQAQIKALEEKLEKKERILIPSDEDMRKKFIDLLSAKTNEEFVEMVLKSNAALSRLAGERFVDTEELLSKEALLPELVIG